MIGSRGFRDMTVGAALAATCVLFSAGGVAHAAPAPSAPATSSGSYTVSYSGCGGCYMQWLEERATGTQAWTTVGTDIVSFADKPDGAWDYRAALVYWGSGYDYSVEYSAIATVVVGGDLPTVQSLREQFGHEYTARVGYHDADARPDLYLERTSGGDGNDGTLRRLILRATASGFRPVVPGSSAVRAARRWPRAAVRLALHDVDLDGFVDVLIGGIGKLSGLAGKPAQIVLGPGRVSSAAPKAVIPVAGALHEFGRDLAGYLVAPDYFDTTAPLTTVVLTRYDFSCQYSGLDVPIYGYFDYCYPLVTSTYVVVPDYTGFSAAAVAIARADRSIANGALSRRDGFARIEALAEEAIGVDLGDRALKELLGEASTGVEPSLERGVELFAALAGISNATAQEADGRGTGSTAADAVLLTGRRVIGFGPFHTALQYGVSTVSAYDSDDRALFDGRLVSQLDWPPDHPALTMRLGRALAALTPALYWQRLVRADRGYGDDLPYDAIPSLGAGGYNSNGFVAGILRATGGTASLPMARFVGGERPVPRSNFD